MKNIKSVIIALIFLFTTSIIGFSKEIIIAVDILEIFGLNKIIDDDTEHIPRFISEELAGYMSNLKYSNIRIVLIEDLELARENLEEDFFDESLEAGGTKGNKELLIEDFRLIAKVLLLSDYEDTNKMIFTARIIHLKTGATVCSFSSESTVKGYNDILDIAKEAGKNLMTEFLQTGYYQ